MGGSLVDKCLRENSPGDGKDIAEVVVGVW